MNRICTLAMVIGFCLAAWLCSDTGSAQADDGCPPAGKPGQVVPYKKCVCGPYQGYDPCCNCGDEGAACVVESTGCSDETWRCGNGGNCQ